ncbi:MAG: four helix bundle protein [Terracidiphilus sp.]
MPQPTARSAVPSAAVVFPLPGPVLIRINPRRLFFSVVIGQVPGSKFQVSGYRCQASLRQTREKEDSCRIWKGEEMLRSFRELTVWQKSMQLATCIYRLTQGFPRQEIYSLTSQLRRAAVSIPSNIAEGQGRSGLGEYRQFLWIARGSNCEVQTQLEIARSLEMGEPELLREAEALSDEVGKMIYSLLEKLRMKTQRPPA